MAEGQADGAPQHHMPKPITNSTVNSDSLEGQEENQALGSSHTDSLNKWNFLTTTEHNHLVCSHSRDCKPIARVETATEKQELFTVLFSRQTNCELACILFIVLFFGILYVIKNNLYKVFVEY